MTRLDHVNLTVSNLESSIEWYGSLFGFKRVEGGVNSYGTRWAILACDDSMIAMTEAPKRLSAEEYKEQGVHRIYHFGLRITDADGWRKKIHELNIPLHYGGEIEYPHSRSWYVHDPSGHEIEVSWTGGKPLEFPK